MELTSSLIYHKGFIWFWLTRLASGFGFQMLSVAVGWQVYTLTGNALDLGLIGLAQFFPSLVLALPAGQAADIFTRRQIIVVTRISELIAIIILALMSFYQVVDKWIIFTLLVWIGSFKAFEYPAMQSIVPSLVPEKLLPKALALNSSASEMAAIVGPALGGFIYIAGADIVYMITALLYFVAVVCMFQVPLPAIKPQRGAASFATLFAGVRFIRQRPVILGVISLDLFAVLLGGATALLPIFARDILHTGPWGLGLLRGAPAVGALLMSFWLARHMMNRHIGMIMFASVAAFGAATLVFSFSQWLWLSLLALVLLGAFDMVSMVIRGALVQLDTPDEMRGRVSAVNAIFINTSNQLGEFESGVLASLVGAVSSAAIGGVGTLVVVGLWMWWFPQLRKRQKLTD
ncbi:MFS transporter [Celerinatantimonas diazotrophica]|uniref:Putative MFS family arabinose efflux permease n=2 Tax=Celerinatantimonas diazotrophica TaxID=412034 RepID=A0A4R1K267_9GAMM|nr:MFS transporter [Celerinatantimonas diazotrophica]TCK58116.1 putative MFS family arabinose efflux permease [Celerinatantimonas diazotrophica]CAG9297812.1 Enterobactin exporter EntS [Celerinatantimonas diazotrophica]